MTDYRISQDYDAALSLFSSAAETSRVRHTAMSTKGPYQFSLREPAHSSPSAGAIIVTFSGHGKPKKAQNHPPIKSVVF
jgi:hypothetical protein